MTLGVKTVRINGSNSPPSGHDRLVVAHCKFELNYKDDQRGRNSSTNKRKQKTQGTAQNGAGAIARIETDSARQGISEAEEKKEVGQEELG